MTDYESVVDAMLFESSVAMLDGGMLEVEPCQFSDCMAHVMEKLRKAEKDAARYRKLKRMAESNGTVGFMLATLTQKHRKAPSFMAGI